MVGWPLRDCEVNQERCTRPAVPDVDPPLCKTHRRQYAKSYVEYKMISSQGIKLANKLLKRLPSVQCAGDVSGRIVSDVELFVATVEMEILARRKHTSRFLRDGACWNRSRLQLVPSAHHYLSRRRGPRVLDPALGTSAPGREELPRPPSGREGWQIRDPAVLRHPVLRRAL